jgi:hypothetical protein
MGLGGDCKRAIDDGVHRRVHLRRQFGSSSGGEAGITTRSEFTGPFTSFKCRDVGRATPDTSRRVESAVSGRSCWSYGNPVGVCDAAGR